MILAPLRGVTIRCFRETFAEAIRDVGFTEAITPFITAAAGYDPLRDRELANRPVDPSAGLPDNQSISQSGNRTILLTPQFIGKDPAALRTCLEKVRDAGYETADLNAGCPFPMVRNKGRGSGLLRTPDVLRRMLEVGCETMGPGKFSLKTRLGVERTDELLKLMPMINLFPLRFLAVHARTAKQMYDGEIDAAALDRVRQVAEVPLVVNGDLPLPPQSDGSLMIGRSFVRYLGTRDDIGALLDRYIAASQAELSGDRPVVGRLKELLAYWKELPRWKRRWPVLKLVRTVDELRSVLASSPVG